MDGFTELENAQAKIIAATFQFHEKSTEILTPESLLFICELSRTITFMLIALTPFIGEPPI